METARWSTSSSCGSASAVARSRSVRAGLVTRTRLSFPTSLGNHVVVRWSTIPFGRAVTCPGTVTCIGIVSLHHPHMAPAVVCDAAAAGPTARHAASARWSNVAGAAATPYTHR